MKLSTYIAVAAALSCGMCVAMPIAIQDSNCTADVQFSGDAPDNNRTTNELEYQFSPPNCTTENYADYNQTLSNITHLDFGIGLHLLKDDLKDVRSYLNKTIALEDGESFFPCYPPPVDINRLQQDIRSRPDSTTVNNLAPWYGVLAAYTRYTSGLLKEDDEIPLPAMKNLTTVFEMLEAILYLFTEVMGPQTCTTVIEVPTYTYNDPECTSTFNNSTLKFAANMIRHLQTVVSHTREVQLNWYTASGIKKYLQTSRAEELIDTWRSRHTSNC